MRYVPFLFVVACMQLPDDVTNDNNGSSTAETDSGDLPRVYSGTTVMTVAIHPDKGWIGGDDTYDVYVANETDAHWNQGHWFWNEPGVNNAHGTIVFEVGCNPGDDILVNAFISGRDENDWWAYLVVNDQGLIVQGDVTCDDDRGDAVDTQVLDNGLEGGDVHCEC
jgi:hypothetical protein